MKRRRAIKTTAICLLALISVLLIYTYAVPPLARLFFAGSGPRITTYREMTYREKCLAERMMDSIIEMEKIKDCEVLVLLDEEPIQPFISVELENNVKYADFTDSDIEAIKSIVSSISMDSESVVIDGNNISFGIGETE